MNWEKVKLGDVCSTIKTGKTPPTSNPYYFGGNINWFCPTDVGKSQFLKFSERTITNKAVDEKKAVIYDEDSLLITCIGEIGRCGVLREKGSSNQQITAIKFKDFIEPRYAYYWFVYNKKMLERLSNNAVVPILNNAGLRLLEFYYPPLHIQKQIANILDKADALRKKDQQLLQKYDELAQAIFIDMFGDPVKNEKGWEVKKLGECIDNLTAGNSFGGDDKTLGDDELGVLKVSAVTSGTFRCDQYKAVKKNLIKRNIIKVKKGDLLFSRANTRELVGATCVVDQDYDYLFLPDKLWRIDLDKNKCLNYFIKFILTQKDIRYNLNKTATGTSGSMLNISMQKLKELEIILPELSVQQQFQRVILNLQLQRKIYTDGQNHTEHLFRSLLQKAFTGELIHD